MGPRFVASIVSVMLAGGLVVAPVAATHEATDALLSDLGMAPLADFSVQKRAKASAGCASVRSS